MRYFFLLVGVLMVYASFVVRVEAATVSLESSVDIVHVGDVVRVAVLVDTKKQTINACELSIEFPREMVDYVSSDDSHSVLSFWVEAPHQQPDNSIRLSGVTPGGFMQPDANLVTLVFKVTHTGALMIEPLKATCLLHDGNGTLVSLDTANLVLTVAEGVTNVTPQPVDDELPEAFMPILMQDADVFNGAPTIVFSTTDKGSGIDHYEVKETWFDIYRTVTSPYQMKYPSFAKKVQVKAVDHAGNERITLFYPQNLPLWYQQVKILGGIVVGCLLVLSVLFIVVRNIWWRGRFS
jgi:hypothetical protein